MFKKATKEQAKLRLALMGVAGSGKTYTALKIATEMGGRVAVVDTEHGSASKYADLFDFDVLELQSFAPARYVEAIHAAEDAGYDVLIIDSLSHAWMGKDGALEMVDRAAKRFQNNKYVGWGEVTPEQNKMIDAMVGSRLHLIVTMRSKMEHVQEKDERGKTVIRKVGMQPVQRDGLEYEFDVVGDLDQSNYLTITKTRCPSLSEMVYHKAGKEVAAVLKAWLADGTAPQPTPTAAVPTTQITPKSMPKMKPSTWERLNALGIKRFGDEWEKGDGERQKKIAGYVSDNQTDDIMSLLENEAQAAIEELEKRLAEMKAAAETVPIPA